MQLNSYIDHTLLKPTSTIADIQKLCAEAIQYRFAAVCVPPPLVKNACNIVNDSGIKTATVIGFPFGYSNVHAKKAEVVQAIKDKADELDMVINLVALKNNAWGYLQSEVKAVLEIVRDQGRILKVIIESGVLTEDELRSCCKIYGDAGVDFVKTSTGYAEKGAAVDDVRHMRQYLPTNVRIKASGGIKTYDFAVTLVEAGADRLGCSASVAIVNGEPTETKGY
jgi:deoxyribose-phosphate aldolase